MRQLESNAIRLICLTLVLLLGDFVLYSQNAAQFKELKNSFPEEDAIFLQQKKHLNIGIEDADLDIKTSFHSKLMFLTENGGAYADKSISYSSFRDILSIDAKTLVPNNNKYKEIEVKEIKDLDRMSGGVFYDDYKEKSFVFPGVREGAIADLKYEEHIKEPRFLGAFYFNSYVPVIESEFTVTFPEDVKLKYILLGDQKELIRFNESTSKGKTTYTWKASNTKKMTFESNAPSLNYYEPHIILYIDEVNINGEKRKILSDVGSLYRWYHELTEHVNQSQNPQLASIVHSLTEGKSKEDKVKSIFYWVMDNIKYVAFEDGLGGFIPREAGEVCSKKYGDCKDMASIITEMLKEAGIEGNLTWIGTRDIPYSYQEVPTPMTDNHMIASVVIDGERVFLDATGENLKFGYPTSMIQGKEALIGYGKDNFELVKVPVVPMEKNVVDEVSRLTIEDGELKGKGLAIYTGYPKFNNSRKIMNAEPSKTDRLMRSLLQRGNNKFEIGEYTIKGERDRDKALVIEYDMAIPDYIKTYEDEIYVNLNLHKKFQNEFIEIDKRELDIEYDYKYLRKHLVKLTVPANYAVDYVPENASYRGEKFGFDIKYENINGEVRLSTMVFINCLILNKDLFSEWNEMIKQLNRAYKEAVVLKLK